MRDSQESWEKYNNVLHSNRKAGVIPEFEAVNISPIITGSGGAFGITIYEFAALITVTRILFGNVELFLALKIPVE